MHRFRQDIRYEQSKNPRLAQEHQQAVAQLHDEIIVAFEREERATLKIDPRKQPVAITSKLATERVRVAC